MDRSLVRNLFQTVYRFRWRLILACIMVLISNGLLIVNPLLFREALLVLVPDESHVQESIFPFFHFSSIYTWAFILLFIATVSALLKYQMRHIFLSLSREVEVEMRDKLFERIQLQSRAFFDRYGIGDLLSRLTNDITAYRDMLGPGLMYPAFFVTLIIPGLVALFYLSPLMAAVSTIPILGIYLLNLWVRRPLLQISVKVQESLADMSRMAHEHYSGIKLIKSYGIEQATASLFRHLCRLFSVLNMRFVSFQSMFFPILVFITKVITISLVVMAAGIILLNWGGKTLSMADFLSFMWIQSYIFGPLLMLAWIMPMYQKGKAAYSRLVEIYEEPVEVYTFSHPMAHLPEHPDIEFRNLSFTYPSQSEPALNHINLLIKSGSFVGITGPVGAGKTTLFRLLNREYEVPVGKIFIGGHDIHEYDLRAFHQEIVTVEQLPFLFSKTVRENVTFGKREATEEELEMVAKQADLHETILDFPHQYETVVGERGVSLSGGQKQRVAIARAFLVNRSILLLDDIFSAVDVETEKKIFQAMKSKFAGKTVLLITHRVSVLEQMDRVIYMTDGRIKEDGTPQELAHRPGPYQALVDLQKLNRS